MSNNRSRVIGNPVGLGFRLNQLGTKAVKHVVEVMRDEGEKIQMLARDYAPNDIGNLERAIQYKEDRGGINQRIRVTVFVNGDLSAYNPKIPSTAGKRVRHYAMEMHEGLAPYGSGAYRLGPESIIKAAGGLDVGGKFLERAYTERSVFIALRVQQMVQNAVRNGRIL